MSIDYLALLKKADAKPLLISDHFNELRLTAKHFNTESHAIKSIQRLWRGYIARKYIAFLNAQATTIKRVWKGYRGRERVKAVRRQLQIKQQAHFFDAMATLIQKVYRGFRSRRKKQDFYRRKQYVFNVTANSRDVCEQINTTMQIEMKMLQEQKSREEYDAFRQVTSNVHHLLGTVTQQGVFGRAQEPTRSYTAFGVPMEAQIQNVFHDNYLEKQRKALEDMRLSKLQQALSPTGRPRARGKGRSIGMDTPLHNLSMSMSPAKYKGS